MSLSQKIITARKNKALTQEELATMSNVTVRTIQRIESGETIPRSYTLKALASSLDIPFEELLSKEFTPATQPSPPKEIFTTREVVLFLQTVNLSSFAYILIPYVHFLIPSFILKKGKGYGADVMHIGRKLIQVQLSWVIALNLLMLLTVAYNFAIVRVSKTFYVHYLWPALAMYFANAIIIILNQRRIKSGVEKVKALQFIEPIEDVI